MIKTKKNNDIMLNGSIAKNIIVYTLPIILTSFLQLLFNAADLIIVGQFCSELSVAAVGGTGALTNLIVTLFIGFSVGTNVSVARAMGAGETDSVKKAIHTALPTALVCGILVATIGVTCSESLLKMMDTPDTVLPLSALYMKIYFMGAPFMMVYNFCAAILRAAGDTKSPLIFLSISGVLNVGLNYIFVTAFDMNVAGVALATISSQCLSAVLVVIALIKRTDECKLFLSKCRFYKKQLLEIIRIGLPAGLQSSLFSISNVLIQTSINSFGDVVMSGNAASSNIEGFIMIFTNGFNQTAINFIAQNSGAKQYKRVIRTFWTCAGYVVAVGIVITSVFYLLAPNLLSFYIPDSPEAFEWGMTRLTFICFFYIFAGLMDTTTGAIRGLGVSLCPMIISLLGVCGFRILWIYTVFQIPQYHTPQCIYYSYPISWIITFAVQLVAFFIIFNHQKKKKLA